MSSRTPLAAIPSDGVAPREPSLTAGAAPAGPRLGLRSRPAGPFDLRAGERAIVTSSDQNPKSGREGWSLAAKVAFAVMGLLALFGAVMLVRLFVVL
jgi:hypothetical protein